MVTRRELLRGGMAVGVAGIVGATSTGGASAAPADLVVNDFEGTDWPGQNALGAWNDAGELANGSGELVDGVLELTVENGGWFATNVQRDVSEYGRLEFVLRGDVDPANVQVEVGDVQDSLANVGDNTIGTSFAPVAVDLDAAGVGQVDDIWLRFWRASGSLEIDEIRFVADGRSTPDTRPPDTPRGLAVTEKTDSSVTLSWYPAAAEGADVDHYRISRSDIEPIIDTVERTSVTINGLVMGSYEFTVRAVDGAGNESEAATVGVTIAENLDVPQIDGNRPTDPDGDGLYEDLNGNGRIDADDVVTFFEHKDDTAIVDHTGAYDFNGNGRIDFDDVATLFESL